MKEKHSSESIKKEFNHFASKVAELETMRRELNALDTSGFEADVKLIKAHLRDVNAVNIVRKRIDLLKKKIAKKYSVHREAKHKAKAEAVKLHDSLQKRISLLEMDVSKKKRIAIKKQLTKKEVASVRDIPKLEVQLSKLRGTLNEHVQSRSLPINSKVDIMVDTHFSELMDKVKSDLSQNLKDKQKMLRDEMQKDLEMQRKVLYQKYMNLANSLHERYKSRVGEAMRNMIKKHFDEAVIEKVLEEKKKILHDTLLQNRRLLDREKERLAKELHERLEREKAREMERMREEENEKMKKLKEAERLHIKDYLIRQKEDISKKSASKAHEDEMRRVKLLREQLQKDKIRDVDKIKEAKIQEMKKLKEAERLHNKNYLAKQKEDISKKEASKAHEDEMRRVKLMQVGYNAKIQRNEQLHREQIANRAKQLEEEYKKKINDATIKIRLSVQKEFELRLKQQKSKIAAELNNNYRTLMAEQIAKKKKLFEKNVLSHLKSLF